MDAQPGIGTRESRFVGDRLASRNARRSESGQRLSRGIVGRGTSRRCGVGYIGTGTGLLALFAIQLGASRVYAIEQGDIVGVAEEIALRNGISASQVELPERVDLVVAELIGSFGLEESIISLMG